jgi:hypothetical protein
MALYGDLFRRRGVMAVGEPPLDAGDVHDGTERELLNLWWREAARVEPRVPGPDEDTMLRTPMAAQRALNALSASRFFAGMTERMIIGSLNKSGATSTNRTFAPTRLPRSRGRSPPIPACSSVIPGAGRGLRSARRTPGMAGPHLRLARLPLGDPQLAVRPPGPRPERGIGAWPGGRAVSRTG